MSQPVTLNVRFSYYYPDNKYLNHLYDPNNSKPVTYEGFQEFELIEQYTNQFVTLGDLQEFVTKITGIPAMQQKLAKADGTLITGNPQTLLTLLGFKKDDGVILKTFSPPKPFDYSTVKTEDQKKAFVAVYPPPAHLDDLDTLDNQVKWAEWESNTADQNIYTGAGPLLSKEYAAYPIAPQFFNPANPETPVGNVSVTKIIAWNGLPGLLRSLMPYTEIYQQSDKVIKHGERTNQTEYCEWKTFYADEAQTKIRKIAFTCEGPEYWQQLFNIDPDKCVSIYQELTGIASITKDDLIAKEDIYLEGMDTPIVKKGEYNFYNEYNTTKGIVHLNQRNNYLSAELNIATMATQLQQQADPQGNLTLLQKALPLVLAGEYGSPGRNSDPTIGFICNWVARHPLGLRLTIQPPVALYFGLLNTTGWTVPKGTGEISDWVKCVRGKPELGQALRYEIAPPEAAKGRCFVNDMTIGGQPIEYGGQIARCMTVQLTGKAAAFPADTPTIAPPVRPRQAIQTSFGTVDPISQQSVGLVIAEDVEAQSRATASQIKHHPKRTPHKASASIMKLAQEGALQNNNPPADSPEEAYQKITALERETILEIDDIQGDPLLGFNTSNSVILLLDIKDVILAKQWLAEVVVPSITTTRDVMKRHDHMNTYRKHQKLGITDTPYSDHPQYTYLNISFSYDGLALLTSPDEVNKFYAIGNSEAFIIGMPKRSTLLGDPDVNTNLPGARDSWKFGGERTPHIMVQIQADTLEDCKKLAEKILDAHQGGLELVYRDTGKRRAGALQKPREQFGFHDGISNPAVRGMYEVENPTHDHKLDYLSKREIDKTDMRWNFYSKPGTSLIWPGELILGYAKQRNISNEAPPPQYYWLPDDDSFIGPDWAKNGTFVLYRRLHQDVAAFWNHAKETAEAVNAQFTQQGALPDWDAEKAASRFIGRWPSGCPIMLSPDKDVEAWGQNKITQNAFMYAVDTPPFPSAQTGELVEGVPTLPSDNIALRCPMGSHVRKVNPRDQGTDFGPNEDTLKHRIMRRGIPFGPFVPEADKFKNDGKDRGFQFIAYMASLDMQFEFLLRFWANFDQQPLSMTAGYANDMVIGQPTQTDYERQITTIALNKEGLPVAATSPMTKARWVYATGGGYFFMPGLSAIVNRLCK